jgi:hypothetical protein
VKITLKAIASAGNTVERKFMMAGLVVIYIFWTLARVDIILPERLSWEPNMAPPPTAQGKTRPVKDTSDK